MSVQEFRTSALMSLAWLALVGGCDFQDHVPWTYDVTVVEKSPAGVIGPLEDNGGRANLLGVRVGPPRKVGIPPNEFQVQVVEVRADQATFEVTHLDKTKSRVTIDRGKSADSFTAGGAVGLRIELRAK